MINRSTFRIRNDIIEASRIDYLLDKHLMWGNEV